MHCFSSASAFASAATLAPPSPSRESSSSSSTSLDCASSQIRRTLPPRPPQPWSKRTSRWERPTPVLSHQPNSSSIPSPISAATHRRATSWESRNLQERLLFFSFANPPLKELIPVNQHQSEPTS